MNKDTRGKSHEAYKIRANRLQEILKAKQHQTKMKQLK